MWTFDVRPFKKSHHVPDILDVCDLMIRFSYSAGIKLVRVTLDLFEKTRIAVPLKEAVGPFWRGHVFHMIYKRECNTYVSYL